MRTELIVALAVSFFIALFVGFWCMVVLLISRMSGWHTLAQQYPATDKPRGQFFALESIYMNSAQYQGALTLGITEGGLYLAPMVLFHAGHPALLVPWNAFRNYQTSRSLWVQTHTVQVVVDGERTVEIVFYNKQVAAILQSMGDRLPSQSVA